MINEYVNKLIENLPDEFKNSDTPLKLDLILDGGLFNGSYLVGALYFLKEMERRNYVKIERISGCSVGSIAAFLYFIDELELMSKLYSSILIEFKQNYNLSCLKNLKAYLGDNIPDDVCDKVNNKLYITYNNIKKGTKPVKCTYKNVDEILNTIIRSSYVPYLIDGHILYDNKCIDGFTPYIFNKEPHKKILYLDLFGYDKIGNLLNVKNEKSNFHRILSGLLDIHSFYIKQSNTQMCSYVNDWSITNIAFNYIKLLFEKICIYITYFLIYIKTHISKDIENSIFYKIFSKISKDIFVIMIETYCL
jgi:hypothetical protein